VFSALCSLLSAPCCLIVCSCHHLLQLMGSKLQVLWHMLYYLLCCMLCYILCYMLCSWCVILSTPLSTPCSTHGFQTVNPSLFCLLSVLCYALLAVTLLLLSDTRWLPRPSDLWRTWKRLWQGGWCMMKRCKHTVTLLGHHCNTLSHTNTHRHSNIHTHTHTHTHTYTHTHTRTHTDMMN
jgi:hypothetical protein